MKRPCAFLLSLLLLGSLTNTIVSASERKPNVVLFLVDDMGWTDCGAYGSTYYKTPCIDAFAKQSMRFTDAYAMPLCSPTRASILSGQYTSRHGVTSAVGHKSPAKAFLPSQADPNVPLLLPESGTYLAPSQYTLAEALRDAGYRTAHIGKWHLGLTEPHWPEAQGFDVTFHCHPDPGPPGKYFSPYSVSSPTHRKIAATGPKHLVGNITDGPPGEYIVDRQADEAERFIESNRERPFFLNLWCYGVHGPWGHKEAYTAEFAKTSDPRGLQGNPIMASMLRSVDECFGRIMAKLDDLGLADNTIVIFTSDNGGNVHSNSGDDAKPKRRDTTDTAMKDWQRWAGDRPPTNNAPLRSGKGRLYEGGTRVPLMVRWPGRIKAASESAAIVGCYDIYPTILELTSIARPSNQTIDGVSYAPVLQGTGPLNRDAYFIWFPHLVPGVSVRQGDWKLIRRFSERPSDYEGLHELFNLKDDLGETNNLAKLMPEKADALNTLIDRFLHESEALLPKPNPAHKSAPKNPKEQAPENGADPFLGLVQRSCKLSPIAGGARVEAQGRNPFPWHRTGESLREPDAQTART